MGIHLQYSKTNSFGFACRANSIVMHILKIEKSSENALSKDETFPAMFLNCTVVARKIWNDHCFELVGWNHFNLNGKQKMSHSFVLWVKTYIYIFGFLFKSKTICVRKICIYYSSFACHSTAGFPLSVSMSLWCLFSIEMTINMCVCFLYLFL